LLAGGITEFPILTGHFQPFDFTPGPDGNLWYTENAAGQ
jgi:streptogramin lyase